MIYIISLFLTLNLMAADDHSSHHGNSLTPSTQLQLNGEKKWETDAPLRQSMEKIKAEMTAQLDKIHHGKLSKSGYEELGGKIDKQVQLIFKNCKLSPEADKQAHLLLSTLMTGNAKMKSEKATEREAGAVQIIGALSDYSKFFAHPGWKNISH